MLQRVGNVIAAAGLILAVFLVFFLRVFEGFPGQTEREQLYTRIASDYAVVPALTADELEALIAVTENEPLMLIDTRSAAEYRISHLKGARLYDEELLLEVSTNQKAVLYCSVGLRSSQKAKQWLKKYPEAEVFQLYGSIFEWVNTGRPVFSNGVETSLVHPYNHYWRKYLDPEHRMPGVSLWRL